MPLDLLAGGVVAGAALASAITDAVPFAAAATVAAAVPAAVVDLREHRLPNRLVALALLVGVLAVLAVGPLDPAGALVGAAALGGPVLAVHLVSPAAMGFGDVKYAAVLGLAVGLVDGRWSLVALAVGAGITAIVAATGRIRRAPLGPGLVVGATTVLWCSAFVSPWEVAG